MSNYKTDWKDGDTVFALGLNRIENNNKEIDEKIADYENNGQIGGAKSVVGSGQSLDNFKTPGVYSFSGTNLPSDSPNGYSGWLVVLAWDKSNTEVKQIWMARGVRGVHDGDIFVRMCLGTVWGQWYKIATALTTNTVADAAIIE